MPLKEKSIFSWKGDLTLNNKFAQEIQPDYKEKQHFQRERRGYIDLKRAGSRRSRGGGKERRAMLLEKKHLGILRILTEIGGPGSQED